MMVFLRRLLVFGSLFCAPWLPSAQAAGDSPPVELHMTMDMGGMTAGTLKLSIDDRGETVSSRLKMKSQGFFKLITSYKGLAEAESTTGDAGAQPLPISYDSTYETRNTERRVEIRYDPADGRIVELTNWKRGKRRDSKVPDELQRTTVDPLTAVLQLRHWIREMRASDGYELIAVGEAPLPSETLEVFDGRRRYRLTADFLDRRTVRLGGERVAALRIKVQMEAIAGFGSNDMLAEWTNEDGQRWIELIITDDDNPVPVLLETHGGSLATTVQLRKSCMGENVCQRFSN